ncbi:hypothetical protein CPB83DRAFT_864685 [Crepidotus variabilis]|uniref:DUF6533 domain-containing protein n=1 Tax=Crepidotus variabilis TaxID=179855 RepID=A0A9P6E4J3_9AGAR|nr:hypothetical protein CPB83DRAFT_864685 [Crepidotus variabilis]
MFERSTQSLGEHLWLERLLAYSCTSALVVAVYDFCLTFDDEVAMIWPQDWKYPAKWIFLVSRYVGLISQIALTIMLVLLPNEDCTVWDGQKWYILNVLAISILFGCMQALLALRVYLLYTRDVVLGVILVSMIVMELLALPVGIYFTLDGPLAFWCFKAIRSKDSMYLGAVFMPPHLIVMGLSTYQILVGWNRRWGSQPIIWTLLRGDALLVVLVLSFFVLEMNLSALGEPYSHFIHWWMLALFPSAICRTIIHTQSLLAPSLYDQHFSGVLTTCIFEYGATTDVNHRSTGLLNGTSMDTRSRISLPNPPLRSVASQRKPGSVNSSSLTNRYPLGCS